MTWLSLADAQKVGIDVSVLEPDRQPKSNLAGSSAIGSQFVEFPEENSTKIYDLSTVQILMAGQFSIMATTIDDPDKMHLRLKVHDVLATYCKRPDGEYEAPIELFTLGPPEMPIEKILVKTMKSKIAGRTDAFREAKWSLPYKRLAFTLGKVIPAEVLYVCGGIGAMNTAERNAKARSEIVNGYRQKEIYDCNRALMGLKLLDPDSIFEPIMDTVRGGYFRYYEFLCRKVTGKQPYEYGYRAADPWAAFNPR